MYSTTKLLSSKDVILLDKEIKNMELGKKISALTLPFVAVLCILSWYFPLHSMIIFISSCLTILLMVGLLVSIKQGNNIRKDLAENCKIVEGFTLEKRFIVKDGKHIMISEDYLEKVAAYKEEIIDKLDKPTFMQRDSSYDKTLRSTFKFRVKMEEQKSKEFIIPINYFIKFKDGDNITIEYAQHSKKVLQVS